MEPTRPMRDVGATVVGIARTLRAAGVGAHLDQVHAFVRALDEVDLLKASDVYWAGRLTMCADPDDLPRYDRCFAAYFSGETPRIVQRPGPPVVIMQPISVPGARPR